MKRKAGILGLAALVTGLAAYGLRKPPQKAVAGFHEREARVIEAENGEGRPGQASRFGGGAARSAPPQGRPGKVQARPAVASSRGGIILSARDGRHPGELPPILTRKAAQAEALRIRKLEPGPARNEALGHLARSWTGLGDGAAMMRWIESLGPEDGRGALQSVAEKFSGTQPVEALRIAVDLPPGEPRDDVMRRSVANWAASEPEQALSWILAQDRGPERELLLAGMLPLWSETDPAGAATVAANELEEGKLLSDTVVGIIQRWARTNPSAARAWVESFPEGPLRAVALEHTEVR